MISTVQIWTTQVFRTINYVGGRRAPLAESGPLITTTTEPQHCFLWITCVIICLWGMKSYRVTGQTNTNWHATYRAATWQEARRRMGWLGSPLPSGTEMNYPSQRSPFTILLLFLSTFCFCSSCPLGHTQKCTRRSVALDDCWITFEPMMPEHI